MPTVSNVNSPNIVNGTSTGQSSSLVSTENIDISTETFLQLLVAQLQYQDPLEPKTDTDFVAQLAQMTSLQELQSMASTMSMSQAYNMIGKYAYAEVKTESGSIDEYVGYVNSVYTQSGTTYVILEDNAGSEYAVPLECITQVFDSEMFSGGTSILEASNLVGKEVEGTVSGSDGAALEVTGTVQRVYYAADGIIYAVLDDGTEIPLSSILSIGTPGSAAGDSSTDAENEAGSGVDAV